MAPLRKTPKRRPAGFIAGPLVLAVGGTLIAPGVGAEAATGGERVARGEYVFAAASCGTCHTVKDGESGGGGRRFDGPFGTVYSTNITPERQDGIGSWNDEQIATAIRLGRRPSGERLIPVHPYLSLQGMADDDVRALVAYLRTLPAVKRANQPRHIKIPLFESVFLPAWVAAFGPRGDPPASAPASGLAHGEYLVRAVSHCGECHTPRNIAMTMDRSRFLAGNPSGLIENAKVPNITPDNGTGIGEWTVDQIADFLATGNTPDGDVAGDLMGELIQGKGGGYKDLTQADRLAIAQYLKTIPPIRNKIQR